MVAILRIAAISVVLAAATGTLCSCGAALERARDAEFSSRLRAIDQSLASGTPDAIGKAFSRAYGKAGKVTAWLSILKRAEAAEDPKRRARMAEAAKRAIAAFPRSAILRAASAHAYLRAGSPAAALALFGDALPPDGKPALWAEAFIESRGEPAKAAAPADYARLAEALGEPEPFIGAAVACMATGDSLSAASWLRKAIAGGARVPATLFWDCGLYDELAARSDSGAGAADLELMGDAAWKAGDIELAARRWARAVALEPASSWRPYANLAMISGSDGDAAESYWARLRSAFLSGPPSRDRDDAASAYAAHLARAGREREALKVVEGSGRGSGRLAVLGLEIGASASGEERYAVELERLAEQRPEDPFVVEAVLRELARRGFYGEVALLSESASRRKVRLEGAWFYEAAALAARGEYAASSARIAGSAAGRSSAAGSFALGSLLSALDDHDGAAREYARAAAAASVARDRCAALKAQGRELASAGDARGAGRAYRAALAADPSDAEAALLAEGRAGK